MEFSKSAIAAVEAKAEDKIKDDKAEAEPMDAKGHRREEISASRSE